ncbi:MAG: SsrA-binding protein SmpB [Candidatus Magnetoovum sp. WYHC-5]|nr:SsrA-binding protein SmpB [Candidatus Magnetoovum sp. WYHC-5]
MSVFSQNKKAYFDYTIEETLEAGLVLQGTEVKSIRQGRANLKDSYVIIKEKEAFLINCHISPYTHGNRMNHEPLRTRKLLLNYKEIVSMEGKASQKGYSLIPLKLYLKGPYIKLSVGLGKGKRVYEKREAIKEKEAKREIERALRH